MQKHCSIYITLIAGFWFLSSCVSCFPFFLISCLSGLNTMAMQCNINNEWKKHGKKLLTIYVIKNLWNQQQNKYPNMVGRYIFTIQYYSNKLFKNVINVRFLFCISAFKCCIFWNCPACMLITVGIFCVTIVIKNRKMQIFPRIIFHLFSKEIFGDKIICWNWIYRKIKL